MRQVFRRAATDVQRCFRGRKGRRRAKEVWLERVETEKKRRVREDRTVETSIKKAVSSVVGRLGSKEREIKREMKKEMKRAAREMRKERRREKKEWSTLTIEEQHRRRAERVFKSYDTGGSDATIPVSSLDELLSSFCLPLSKSEIKKVGLILKSRPRPAMGSKSDASSMEVKKKESVVRFEDFWQLLGSELSGSSVSSVVSDGQTTSAAIGRMRMRMRATSAFRSLTGKTKRERVERWLFEEARVESIRRARENFRRASSDNAPSFCCMQCLRPFTFDYEVSSHQHLMGLDCERFDTYDMLREEEYKKEKERKEEELVIMLAREGEREKAEKFRRPNGEEEGGEENAVRLELKQVLATIVYRVCRLYLTNRLSIEYKN